MVTINDTVNLNRTTISASYKKRNGVSLTHTHTHSSRVQEFVGSDSGYIILFSLHFWQADIQV